MSFIELIDNTISINTNIPNWSIDSKIRIPYYIYLGIKNENCILKQPFSKKIIEISESSFQYLYSKWTEYLNGDITRHQLRNGNNQTTYTICILHYLFENNVLA